jgi:hypothetical protein
LHRLSDRGHVPEALRLAHLIGSAVEKGESGRQALITKSNLLIRFPLLMRTDLDCHFHIETFEKI